MSAKWHPPYVYIRIRVRRESKKESEEKEEERRAKPEQNVTTAMRCGDVGGGGELPGLPRLSSSLSFSHSLSRAPLYFASSSSFYVRRGKGAQRPREGEI